MSESETRVPGPFRTADGSHVPFSEAKLEWAHVGYDRLVDVARDPLGLAEYQALADEMVERSGISTRTLMPQWIGRPLWLIALACHQNGEPDLTSLVVGAKGHLVKDGHAAVYELRGEPAPADLQARAAAEREACHRHYRDNEPVGWHPDTVTYQPQPVRKRPPRRETREEIPPVLCTTCHTALPANGECYYCG